MAGLIATKLEMTRVIKEDKFIQVTLLKIPELRVFWFKTLEKDGYEAVIVWVLKEKAEGKIKTWNATLSKNDFSLLKEFNTSKEDAEKYKTWDVIGLDLIEDGIEVGIEWTSKWRWFAWAMKRHNFHGWPAGHGSKFHRALGSIGNRKPTRTHKGKKMHGHYGDVKVSFRAVPVELINKEAWVIWVRWGVPGARNSIVNIILN